MAFSKSAAAAGGVLFLALFLPIAPPSGRCPVNALGFSVSSLFGGLVNVSFGNLPRPAATRPSTCCALIAGLATFDAETCLCTAFNASVFGAAYALNVTGGVSLLLNYCRRNSTGYRC